MARSKNVGIRITATADTRAAITELATLRRKIRELTATPIEQRVIVEFDGQSQLMAGLEAVKKSLRDLHTKIDRVTKDYVEQGKAATAAAKEEQRAADRTARAHEKKAARIAAADQRLRSRYLDTRRTNQDLFDQTGLGKRAVVKKGNAGTFGEADRIGQRYVLTQEQLAKLKRFNVKLTNDLTDAEKVANMSAEQLEQTEQEINKALQRQLALRKGNRAEIKKMVAEQSALVSAFGGGAGLTGLQPRGRTRSDELIKMLGSGKLDSKQFGEVMRNRNSILQQITSTQGGAITGRAAMAAQVADKFYDLESGAIRAKKGVSALDTVLDKNIKTNQEFIGRMGAMGSTTVRTSQRVGLLGESLRALSTNMIDTGKNMQWTGRQIATGITLPILAGAAAAGYFAYTFDKEMVRFRKVFNTEFGVGTDMAERKVVELANSIVEQMGRARNETIEVAAAFAQMGLEIQEIERLTFETMRLGTLGEIDNEDSIELIRALNATFGLEGEAITNAANTLNAIENNTTLAMKDLAGNFQQIAPLFDQFGIGVGEGAAILAVMNESLGNASEATNALKVTMQRILSPTQEARDQFAALNLEYDDILRIADTNGLAAAMGELGRQATELGLSASEYADAFGTLVGARQGGRALTAFEGIYRQQQAFEDGTGIVNDYGRALSVVPGGMRELGRAVTELEIEQQELNNAFAAGRELQQQQESVSGKTRKALERIRTVLSDIGEGVLVALEPALDSIKSAVDAFNNLSESTKNTIGQVLKYLAAMGPVVMIVGILKTLFGTISKLLVSTLLPGLTMMGGGVKTVTSEMARQKAELVSITNQFKQEEAIAEDIRLTIALVNEEMEEGIAKKARLLELTEMQANQEARIRNLQAAQFGAAGAVGRARINMGMAGAGAALGAYGAVQSARSGSAMGMALGGGMVALELMQLKMAGGAAAKAVGLLIHPATLAVGAIAAITTVIYKRKRAEERAAAAARSMTDAFEKVEEQTGVTFSDGVRMGFGSTGNGIYQEDRAMRLMNSFRSTRGSRTGREDLNVLNFAVNSITRGDLDETEMKRLLTLIDEEFATINLRINPDDPYNVIQLLEMLNEEEDRITGGAGTFTNMAQNFAREFNTEVARGGFWSRLFSSSDLSAAGEAFGENAGNRIANSFALGPGALQESVIQFAEEIGEMDLSPEIRADVFAKAMETTFGDLGLETTNTNLENLTSVLQTLNSNFGGEDVSGVGTRDLMQAAESTRLTGVADMTPQQMEDFSEDIEHLGLAVSATGYITDTATGSLKMFNDSMMRAGTNYLPLVISSLAELGQVGEATSQAFDGIGSEDVQKIANNAMDVPIDMLRDVFTSDMLDPTNYIEENWDELVDDEEQLAELRRVAQELARIEVNTRQENRPDPQTFTLDPSKNRIVRSDVDMDGYISMYRSAMESAWDDYLDETLEGIDEMHEAEMEALDEEIEMLEDKAERQKEAREDEIEGLEDQLALLRQIQSRAQSELNLRSAIARGDLGQAAQIQQGIAFGNLEDQFGDQIEGLQDEMALIDERTQREIDAIEEIKDAREEAHEKVMENLKKEFEQLALIAPKTEAEWAEAVGRIDAVLGNYNISTPVATLAGESTSAAYTTAVQNMITRIEQDNEWEEMGAMIVGKLLAGAGLLESDYWSSGIPQGLFDLGEGLGTPLPTPFAGPGYIMGEGYQTNDPVSWYGGSSNNSQVPPTVQHSGGHINGRSRADVPIIAQEGEYMIQRRAAQALGHTQLEMLNNAHKYHTGGAIGAMTNIPAAVMSRMAPRIVGTALASQLSEVGGELTTPPPMPNVASPAGAGTGSTGVGIPTQNGLVFPDYAKGGFNWRNKLNNRVIEKVSTILASLPGAQVVTSGYRDLETNRRVGGSPTSHHLHGNAVDIVDAERSGVAALNRIAQAFKGTGAAELLYPGNRGDHQDHVHVAYRHEGGPISLAKGGMLLKNDVLANLHKGEAVLRAPVAKALESAIMSGSMGGNNTTIEINIENMTGEKADINRLANEIAYRLERQNSKHSRSRVIR